MLFNPELRRVMIIDFERAKLVQPPRRVLSQLVPNKRAWSHGTSGKSAKEDENPGSSQRVVDVEDDMVMARSALLALNWYQANDSKASGQRVETRRQTLGCPKMAYSTSKVH